MKHSDSTTSLRRRIVVAYLFFSLAFCILFTVIAAIAVEGIEVRLVDRRLENVAAWASARHAGHLPAEMPTGLSFYHGAAIPPALRGLSPGLHEVDANGIGLQVLAGSDADGEYVAVDHDSDYEAVEILVYSTLAAVIAGFLLFSLFFGRYVARRIVNPITDLAVAVRDRDAESELPLLQNADEMGELARAFAARSTEAQQFLQRERFFTGDVSHELRTPLTVISGAAELLALQTSGRADLHGPAERILRAAREASECVNALLLLARSPQLDTELAPVRAVVEAEIERHRFLLRDKPVLLDFSVNHDFSVQARRELLGVAIGNLIRNACLYTQQGTITVQVQDGAVTVEDTGPGIPAEVLSRLSEKSGLPGPASSAGSGLGLSLVQRVCERLDAQLVARQRSHEEGGGAVFTIRFVVREHSP